MTTLFLEIFDEMIDKLQDEGILLHMISNFGKIRNVYEKLEFIDEILEKHLRRPEIPLRKTKNNEKSAKLRKTGNRHFASADYKVALKMYNKSICYAENDSEEMSLGYANRSAAYFELGWHDECLQNIEFAKKMSNFPVRLMDKLNKRETLCLEQREDKTKHRLPEADQRLRETEQRLSGMEQRLSRMKQRLPGMEQRLPDTEQRLPDLAERFLKTELSFPAHPQIPFIANCLKLERNAQWGRHVITTSDLKAGDIVAFEESFCSSLRKDYKYTRCENCLIHNNSNLIPCKHCTAAMFCGDECCDEAYKKFHKFECPFIDYATKMFCNNPLLAVRTIICAVTTFKSVDELIAFVEETRGQDLTVFDCNFEDKSRNVYGPVQFLSKENKSSMEEFSSFIVVAEIYQSLLEFTELGKMFTTTKAIRVFKELVLHYFKMLAINISPSDMFENLLEDLNSSHSPDVPRKEKREAFATSVHPFRSLLNHSCAPNVIVSSCGKKIVFTISRPIKAGEQLFENYEGCHFNVHSYVKRQQILQHFTCQCVACENRYPLYDKLVKGTIPELPTDETMAVEQTCADYINTYSSYYPCQEVVQAEKILRFVLNLSYAGRV